MVDTAPPRCAQGRSAPVGATSPTVCTRLPESESFRREEYSRCADQNRRADRRLNRINEEAVQHHTGRNDDEHQSRERMARNACDLTKRLWIAPADDEEGAR